MFALQVTPYSVYQSHVLSFCHIVVSLSGSARQHHLPLSPPIKKSPNTLLSKSLPPSQLDWSPHVEYRSKHLLVICCTKQNALAPVYDISAALVPTAFVPSFIYPTSKSCRTGLVTSSWRTSTCRDHFSDQSHSEINNCSVVFLALLVLTILAGCVKLFFDRRK